MNASEPSPALLQLPQPRVRWSTFTDAALKGMVLAREVERILLWDEADTLYLLDAEGKRLARRRAPSRLVGIAGSDDGSLFVAAGEAGVLWFLDAALMPRQDRKLPERPVALASDALGHYVALCGEGGTTLVLDHSGRTLARFRPVRPSALVQFVPAAPLLVAAAHYGMAACYTVRGRHSDALRVEPRWEDNLWSNAGGLAASGDGRMILIACFTHGIQRYRIDGRNEGAYHLAGSPARVAIDYDGRFMAATTIEGEVQLLNAAGQVLWRHTLARPAVDVALDAQGRYLLYGLPTGEVTLLDLREQPVRGAADGIPPAELDAPEAAAPGGQGRIRRPSWSIQAATDPIQASTAVLALTERPRRVVLFTNRNRLEFYNSEGKRAQLSPELLGVGRMIRSTPGWVAGATDRQVVLYRGTDDRSWSIDARLVQITHFDLEPGSGGLILVQERDRLTRLDRDGAAAWMVSLSSPVEDLAVGPEGHVAVTLDDGSLRIVDRGGQSVGSFRPPRPEPLALSALPDPPAGDPDEPAAVPIEEPARFATLARRDQVVRGHALSGAVVWQAVLPLEAWTLHRAGSSLVATAPDGSALVLDRRGRIEQRSREIPPNAVVFERADGSLAAAYRRADNLVCSTLAGNVLWRHVADRPLGPLAAGRMGVACIIGYQLCVFLDRG